MNKRKIQKVVSDLSKLRIAIDDALIDLEELFLEEGASKNSNQMFSEEDLRKKWSEIKEDLKEAKDKEEFLRIFVNGKTKKYLNAFIRANSLIDFR